MLTNIKNYFEFTLNFRKDTELENLSIISTTNADIKNDIHHCKINLWF